MREFFKNMKISFILAAALYIVLGLILLIWPNTSGDVICFSLGLLLLLYGVITIISFFVHDSRLGAFRFELVLGVAGTALGILFLARPSVVLSILPVVLGVYIIIDALLNLKRAVELRRMAYPYWWAVLILSLISVALGVFILFRPYMTARVLIMVIGGVFIYTGLSDLWTLFKLSRVTKAWRAEHPIEVDPIDIE